MTTKSNAEIATKVWGKMSEIAIESLEDLTKRYSLRVASGDLLYIGGATLVQIRF
jgi:hypothetical protein